MGIDLIRGGRIANRGFRTTKSSNSYLKTLIRVPHSSRSSTPSSPEEPSPSSMRSSTSDSTSPGSTATPSPFPESPGTSPRTTQLSQREKLSTTPASLLWSDRSPMTSACSTSLRDSESQPSSSPRLPATESLLLEARHSPSTSSPNWPQQARESCCSAAQEIARPRGISASARAKRDPTLLRECDRRAGNSSEQEEEDDLFKLSNGDALNPTSLFLDLC